MTRRILTLAVAFSASAISSSSSIGAQATAQDQPPVFRTAARLVQVNVTVMDSHGRPVTDLRLGDFTIRESGTPREIALFRFEGGISKAATRPPLPPGVFTNQVQFIGGPPRNITALVLDAVNTSITDNWFIRSQVLSYLKESLTPDTRLAIYALSDSLKTIVDFTDDADLLRSRLDETVVSLSPPTRFRRDRIRQTLGALDALARHLEGIPGRKSVVWMTGGFSVLSLSENTMARAGNTRRGRWCRLIAPRQKCGTQHGYCRSAALPCTSSTHRGCAPAAGMRPCAERQ